MRLPSVLFLALLCVPVQSEEQVKHLRGPSLPPESKGTADELPQGEPTSATAAENPAEQSPKSKEDDIGVPSKEIETKEPEAKEQGVTAETAKVTPNAVAMNEAETKPGASDPVASMGQGGEEPSEGEWEDGDDLAGPWEWGWGDIDDPWDEAEWESNPYAMSYPEDEWDEEPEKAEGNSDRSFVGRPGRGFRRPRGRWGRRGWRRPVYRPRRWRRPVYRPWRRPYYRPYYRPYCWRRLPYWPYTCYWAAAGIQGIAGA